MRAFIISFWELHQKFHFTWKTKFVVTTCQWVVPARNLQIIENFLTLESSQYHKSGSTFSSSKPVTQAACSNCSRFGNTLLAHLTSRTCACQRAWPLILKSKTSIFFWNSLWEWLPDDRQGLDLGLKLEICSLSDCHMTSLTCRGPNLDSTWTLLSDQRIVKLLSAWNNSLHKLCGVWILFRSFEDADIAKVTFSSDSARQMAFCCLWLRSRTWVKEPPRILTSWDAHKDKFKTLGRMPRDQ